MAERSHEIHCREDFSLLCNWRMLYNGAVEVGVDKGEFAQCFLSRWFGDNYYGIDDYLEYEHWGWDRTGDQAIAAIRLERYAVKARLVRGDSLEVAKKFLGVRTFDFIYIDGDHKYESVIADLDAWFTLASPRGIMAGHDYDSTHPGVIRAVDEFFKEKNMQVYLTHEEEKCFPSWYVYIGGLPGPDWKRL